MNAAADALRSHASKRILLILHEPPLPFGGAAARWYFVLLNALVNAGHQVVALCPARKEADIAAARQCFPAPRFELKCFLIPSKPRSVLGRIRSFRKPYSYLLTDELRAEVRRQLAADIDIVHLEQHWTGWLDLPDNIRRERTVINVHYLFQLDRAGDTQATTFRARLLNRRTLAAERMLARRFPNWVALTPPLSEAVHRMNPAANVRTIPMTIDRSLYEFQLPPDRREDAPPTLGLIGSFNWTPGADAAVRLIERIWPRVRGRLPHARLLIVGRAARAMLGRFESTTPNLELHEDVADTIPYFRRLDALLYAPSAGSGMKVKILEAFALGTPVVTNRNGIEGLAVTNEVEASVCESDDALIDAAIALLSDADLRRRRSNAARALLERSLGAAGIIEQWNAVYDGLLAARQGETP